MRFNTLCPHHLVNREAHGNSAFMTDGGFDFLDGLEPKTGAVLERAAIFIRTLVGQWREELHRQNAVRAIDINDIKSCLHRPLCGIDIQLLKIQDIALVRLARVVPDGPVRGRLYRPPRHCTGFQIRRPGTIVPELNTGQRAPFMHAVRHMPEIDDVAIVPQGREHVGRKIRFRGDRAGLGTNAAPAAFGLHFAERGLCAGPERPCAVTMGNLIKPIFHGLRANFDGLKENIVIRVSRHCNSPVKVTYR